MDEVERSICLLTPAASLDQLADAIGKLDGLIRRGKELRALLDDQLMEYVKANGPVVVGTIRYYLGVKKTTRCTDTAKALEAVMDAAGGDLGAAAAVLVAQPFKHGAARVLLPAEAFEAVFTTAEEDELKEGKPTQKTLQRVDTRFVEQ